MFLSLSRIIKYGFQNFLRNGWLTIATVAVMILALFILESLLIFNFISQNALATLKNKIDIAVYFKNDVSEDQILQLKRLLEENLSEIIKKVEYISRDQALAEMKANYQIVTPAIEILETNPLLASLNIKAHDPKDYAVIAAYLNNDNNASLKPLIEKITYAQSQPLIEKLIKIVDTINKGGIILSITAITIAVLVTFNTIALAIHANQESIGIMRVVGASNNFIRGPFIVEGIIYGLLAGVLSVVLMLPLIFYSSPYLINFIPEVNLRVYFINNFIRLLSYQLIFGIVLGSFSSYIAVRQYLKT